MMGDTIKAMRQAAREVPGAEDRQAQQQLDGARAVAEAADGIPPHWDEVPPAEDVASEEGRPGDGPGDDLVTVPRSLLARLHLPDDCPVVPLGLQDDTNYYLDVDGQLRAVKAEKHSQNTIKHLFGRKYAYLFHKWPRLKVDPETKEFTVTGWKPEEAGMALMEACSRKGVWNPSERVRGAGCWLGIDGELIVHYGNRVVVYPVAPGVAVDERRPGLIGDLVYPSRPALPRPAETPATSGAGGEILADLKTWAWKRPDIDPYLLLGHLVAGVLGGALEWRPLTFAVGGRGRGKSSLHKYFKGLLTRWLLATSDTTAAGIWQKLGQDSRPVDLDEAESTDDDASRNRSLLKLARAAASGDSLLRGDPEHQGKEFMARSAFLFSATTMPPMNAADRSRFAVLELLELPKGAKPPVMTGRRLQELGGHLLRRIVDQWRRFADTLDLYRQAMAEAGHIARGQDLFGTLLACQDLVLHDELPDSDTLAEWTRLLRAEAMAELVGDLEVERACLLHLLTQRLEAYRGGVAYAVGEWVRIASDFDAFGHPSDDARNANGVLRGYGMEVRPAPKDKETREPRWPGLFLWVANRHTTLSKLFDRTKWAGGADTQGGWVQHLVWLPDAKPNISFHCGAPTKATLIPLDLCLKCPPDGGPDDSSAAGRSPTPGLGSGAQASGASGRSAADTVSPSASAPSPDDFSLKD